MTASADNNEIFSYELPNIIKIDGIDVEVLPTLHKFFIKIKGVVLSTFENYPLTNKDFLILKSIWDSEQSGNLISSGEISSLFDVSRSAVSQFTSSLEDRGYIQREISSKDKRKTYFTLKPKSIVIMQEINKNISKNFFDLKKQMGEDNFNQLIKLASMAIGILENITHERNIDNK